MRVFITYNKDGEIVSVSKVKSMPEGVEHPFGMLNEGESVLEVPAKGEMLQLEALQIHEQFKVSVAKKKLVKKP